LGGELTWGPDQAEKQSLREGQNRRYLQEKIGGEKKFPNRGLARVAGRPTPWKMSKKKDRPAEHEKKEDEARGKVCLKGISSPAIIRKKNQLGKPHPA